MPSVSFRNVQVQPVPEATVRRVAKDRATFSPVVTLEPRRRRFHQPVTLTMPLPPPLATAEASAAEPFGDEVDPDNLRLLCSLTGKLAPFVAVFTSLLVKERKSIYIAPFYTLCISQSAQACITYFYLQIHYACFSFLSVHQMALPLTELTDIQLQLTTHLSTRRDERLSWPGWLTYSGRFTHISGHPSATALAQDRKSWPVKDRHSTAVPRSQPTVGVRSIVIRVYVCLLVCLSVCLLAFLKSQ